ncbi:UNVERIFIED_CONTAM: hypothetical protein GTU68_039906 [Idotea baltica]|nr:hypothetical protein [Idotea baltica]
MSKVRTRYAPSPTGFQHIGGIRTALYAYLFAKQNNGDLILRIEDTDRNRFVEGAEKYITESLEWLGITCNEGTHVGGDFGPYRQSERKDMYRQYAEYMINNGTAYYAFDTPEKMAAVRETDANFKYGVNNRMGLNNSLTLDKVTVDAKLAAGEPYVIRIKVPANELVLVKDHVRGNVEFASEEIDDKVLLKGDGMPTYHLANVVDDHLMEITHVIRGEEWLPSTPLHVLLYRSLGWGATMPEFAHLPLLMNPGGKGKLSKRSGDKSSNGYKEMGFLPDAFVNFLAFLGWNPGTEQEIFDMEGLVKAFALENVSKSGAQFDFDKAKWFNQQYIMQMSDADLAAAVLPFAPDDKKDIAIADLTKIAGLLKERTILLPDFWEQADYFFNLPAGYEAKTVKKKWKEDNKERLRNLKTALADCNNWISEDIEKSIKGYIETNSYSFGDILLPFRIMLTGVKGGPSVFDIAEILGKEESLNRMDVAFEKFEAMVS